MRKSDMSLDAVESQATVWLARRDRGLSTAEQIEFARWCAADPHHMAVVNEIAAVWTAFDRPNASGRIESLRAELHTLERRKQRRWMAGGAATAFAAACLTVFFGLQYPPVQESATPAAVTVTARVIEAERQTLPDGSIIELRHDAGVSVAFDDKSRVVILQSGEAHFSVAKDPARPFIVETGTARISAVGTAFAVAVGQAAVEVIVTEGRVRVDSTPSPPPAGAGVPRIRMQDTSDAASTPIVEAGQRVVVPLGVAASIPTVISIPMAEFSERLSWRLPRLEFSDASVADAIAMFNRHNQRQLHVPDRAVAAMRITGVFRSDNVEGFVRALESSLGVHAERRDGEILLRRAI